MVSWYQKLTPVYVALFLLIVPGSAHAAEDNNPPKITSFSLSPTEVNTDNGSQVVTVNVTLTDDWAGVYASGDSSFLDYGTSSTQLSLTPLIGTQRISFMLRRVAGTDLNGTYEATATIPMGSKVGVWAVEDFLLIDKLYNYQFLSADDLSNLFPNVQGLTVVNTAEAQSVKIDRDWTIATPQTSVTFPAGTVVTKKEGGSFDFYKMTSQELSLVDLPPTDLEGTPVVAVRLGIPGLNLSFSKNVSVTFKVDPKYNGQNLLIQSLVEGGASWANEKTAQVVDGAITFTVDHATRFTANKFKDEAKPSASMLSLPVSTRTSKTTAFKVNWSSSDPVPSSGIASYDVQYKVNSSGVWKSWKKGVKVTSGTFRGSAGESYYFRAKVKDKAGNISAWSKVKRTIVPYDNDSLILRRRGFGKTYSDASSKFYRGTVRYSPKKGHLVVYKFTGKTVSLVATKAKNRSKAKIYIDGKFVKTVDAYASTFKPRKVIFSKAWAKSGIHSIKVVNLGTPGRRRFDVDGLAVGR